MSAVSLVNPKGDDGGSLELITIESIRKLLLTTTLILSVAQCSGQDVWICIEEFDLEDNICRTTVEQWCIFH